MAMFSSQLAKDPETQRLDPQGAAHHQPHTSAHCLKGRSIVGGLEYLLIK